jgi:hypothetical protein
MDRPFEFYNQDRGPARTDKLNKLAACEFDTRKRVGVVEEQIGTASPSGTPGDPGDMVAWFDNGLI